METTQTKMNKPLKTAGALRAGDTEFLNRPKLSETLALRAANHLEREDLLRHVTFPDSFKGDCAEIIASEFSVLDELVECLRDLTEAVDLWEKSVQDIIGRQPQSG